MLKDGLRLELECGVASTTAVDFNRFRFRGVPVARNISMAALADRDDLVYKWFRVFKENNEYSDRTLHGYIHDFIKYIRVCDDSNIPPESEGAVTLWERHLVEQVRLNGMNVNSARKLISSIKSILSISIADSHKWFSPYSIFRSEIKPTKAYSDNELSKLLKIFHALFNQLYIQIIDNKEFYLTSSATCKTTSFSFKGHSIAIASAVTKCFCAAYYLLSYFTLSNSTTLLKMVKVDKRDVEGRVFFEQSVLKPRANKYVSICIGDNGTFHVPKYALRFFERLLKLSSAISPGKHLLYQVKNSIASPLEVNHIAYFSKWLQSTFNIKDDHGELLIPTTRKFRASGSFRFLMRTGSEIDTSILLGNTPQVLKRHYTSGNEAENNQQLLATALTLENAVKCADIEEAKQLAKLEMNVEILPYEEFLSKYSPKQGQKTVIGTGCKNPHSEQAEKYQRKMNFNPKDFIVENLACSEITNCFFCKNQVIIESAEDIWCLLSFKLSIIESKEEHINPSQFQKNFGELLNRIELILFKINPVIRRAAEKLLNSQGRHPFWLESLNKTF